MLITHPLLPLVGLNLLRQSTMQHGRKITCFTAVRPQTKSMNALSVQFTTVLMPFIVILFCVHLLSFQVSTSRVIKCICLSLFTMQFFEILTKAIIFFSFIQLNLFLLRTIYYDGQFSCFSLISMLFSCWRDNLGHTLLYIKLLSYY